MPSPRAYALSGNEGGKELSRVFPSNPGYRGRISVMESTELIDVIPRLALYLGIKFDDGVVVRF